MKCTIRMLETENKFVQLWSSLKLCGFNLSILICLQHSSLRKCVKYFMGIRVVKLNWVKLLKVYIPSSHFGHEKILKVYLFISLTMHVGMILIVLISYWFPCIYIINKNRNHCCWCNKLPT